MNKELYLNKDLQSTLFFYSPYNFDRNISREKILSQINQGIQKHIDNGNYFHYQTASDEALIIYEYLKWDSDFFKLPTYKIDYLISNSKAASQQALKQFIADVLPTGAYVFGEFPSEDLHSLQALGLNSFRLIETRLAYFNNHLHDHQQQRFGVRSAQESEIENLRNVAAQMVNIYDRFHADDIFSREAADSFLSVYVENSIKGFADMVMVPNEPNLPADSFLTARYQKADWEVLDYKISKMVLSAVSAATNKGWYIKLISEMMYHMRDEVGSQSVILNTQSTNRAVYGSWEKLGFKMGGVSHIFSLVKQ